MDFSWLLDVGSIGKWLQAVGLIVILWLIIQLTTLFFNRKRRLLLQSIDERLISVEEKLDKIMKKSV